MMMVLMTIRCWRAINHVVVVVVHGIAVVSSLCHVLMLLLRQRRMLWSEAVSNPEDASVAANTRPEDGQEVRSLSDVVHEVGALHHQQVGDFFRGGAGLVKGDPPQTHRLGEVLVEHSGAWKKTKTISYFKIGCNYSFQDEHT